MGKINEEESPLLVTLDEKFFDVSAFEAKHPGGRKVLRQVAGEDIALYMAGEATALGVRHKHSNAAYDILKRYSLDGEFVNDILIDSKKPTLWEVGHLKDKYWAWIHRPYDGTIRLFKIDFLEQMTRTKWWVVPCVWMPIVLYYFLVGISIFLNNSGFLIGSFTAMFIFFIGCLAWTLLEYTLHRGLFHWKPNPTSYGQITLHFLLHGLHHKTPMDKDRLVFPPAAAALIVAILYTFYRLILPFPIFCCYAGGKLFGYVFYDMTHYYLHHGSPAPKSSMYFKKLYHHNHHFKDTNTGYGISTIIWDYIFGTMAIMQN